jgi:hypothetical protein
MTTEEIICALEEMPREELDKVHAAMLVIREEVSERLRVEMVFRPYNPRRYATPWCARITEWRTGLAPEVCWGRYLGDEAGGVGEIEVRVGDVVRWGQRDTLGGSTTRFWGIVDSPTEIRVVREPDARRHWLRTHGGQNA